MSKLGILQLENPGLESRNSNVENLISKVESENSNVENRISKSSRSENTAVINSTKVEYCSFLNDKPLSHPVSADWAAQWFILYERTKEVPLGSVRPPTDGILRCYKSAPGFSSIWSFFFKSCILLWSSVFHRGSLHLLPFSPRKSGKTTSVGIEHRTKVKTRISRLKSRKSETRISKIESRKPNLENQSSENRRPTLE